MNTDTATSDTATTAEHHDVVIIGAGAGGLYMLYSCRKLGLDAVLLERAAGVGGTWYWNRYPGVRCDVESLDYSFGFDAELQREWRWEEKYSTGPQICAYLDHVADRFELRHDIRLRTNVVGADFDESSNRWTVQAEAGAEVTQAGGGGEVTQAANTGATRAVTYSADYVVAATGVLSTPKNPVFPGQSDFGGDILLSSEWPEGYDFTGKRVAVVGTGSTGIQIVPLVAEQAEKLYVMQRTPAYSIPAFNRLLSDEEFEAAVASYPERRRINRHSLLGVDTKNGNVSTFEVSDAEAQSAYRANFEYGGPMKLLTTFNDAILDRKANDVVSAFLADRIRERFGDADFANKHLVPDYPVGSRRLSVDTNYYESLARDNVEVVDLRETPIVSFTASGIRTTSADYEVDVIVTATGFDAVTGTLRAIDPRGRYGVSLRRKWGEYPASYLGVMIAGFPNFFTVTGPLSPSVNSNMFVAIEQHVEFIAALLAHATEHGHGVIEATPEAEAEWVRHSAELANTTVFPLTDSWYSGANIAGKASAILPYLGGINGYQDRLDAILADGFRGFTVSEAALVPA